MCKIFVPYYIFFSSLPLPDKCLDAELIFYSTSTSHNNFENITPTNKILHTISYPSLNDSLALTFTSSKKTSKKTSKNVSKKTSKKIYKKQYKTYYIGDSIKVAEGMASFYHEKFQGRQTASGSIFDQNKLTAASNIFPLNTWVHVINFKNNDTIKVLINDRMHPKMLLKGRIIDLSKKGAQLLNFIHKGVLKVKVVSLTPNSKNKE
ncbi:MAG: septal ring lytic transglycosylase RlpA family protein [Alphaproteobacteria bacterium]|nr:septal ring lytic transglycosylase RlpA family protein [Alphaproteobacteria bacterium]